MFRIVFLSKYPPLEGGIAAKSYWITRGFAEAGHEIHVITDPIDAGGAYRIPASENPVPEVPNLHVHRPENEMPWHLPDDTERFLALLNLTIEVIREYDIQILDTGYLMPYGIIGHQAKLSTGVRHVMRHGGSDIEKFLRPRVLGTVLDEAIAGADMIITEERHRHLFEAKNPNVVCRPPYIPDEKEFAPGNPTRPRKRLAVIGKINYHWQHKGLGDIAKIMLQIGDGFECQIIGHGKGFADFQSTLGLNAISRLQWRPFVPPWEMPSLLSQLDAVFIFESSLPQPVFSNLALEAMCSGVGIITDRVNFAGTYKDVVSLDENAILVISPSETSSAASMIERWISRRLRTEPAIRQLVDYDEYLSSNRVIYGDIL